MKKKFGLYDVVDLPGTYSLLYDSPEEKITSDYISAGNYACIIIVVNATALERNLHLAIQILSKTRRAVLCLNMMDEAREKGFEIDTEELSLQLGIPVIETSANRKNGIEKLISTALKVAENKSFSYSGRHFRDYHTICTQTEDYNKYISQLSAEISDLVVGKKGTVYTKRDKILDSFFTSKTSGILTMLFLFVAIFWITSYAANIPSEMLYSLFNEIRTVLSDLFRFLNVNMLISDFLINGVFTTVMWVVSVMLPPALIFFPLFAILEDSGYLPRVAFNLDRVFSKVGTNGKHALSMLMGLGCNSCGVSGCRIISNTNERNIAIITNSFMPCNGRLPTLIALISIFFATTGNALIDSLITSFAMTMVLLLSFTITLLISYILARLNKNRNLSPFILELPPYRKPQIIKSVITSVNEKVLYVLSRAVLISAFTGAVIWIVTNTKANGISLLEYATRFIDPIAIFIGLDGVILTAFILGFPANEIVIPVILMSYLGAGSLMEYSTVSELSSVLTQNGWSLNTAICTIIMCLFHFPCSTTCFTIKKESGSTLWTIMAIIIPFAVGVILCYITTLIFRLAGY